MISLIPVQINMVLSVLLICLFIHASVKMNRKTTIIRLFMWIMGLVCATLLLEMASVLLDNPAMVQWILLNKLVNMAGFIIAPLIPFLGFLLCREWIIRFGDLDNNDESLLKSDGATATKKGGEAPPNPSGKKHHLSGCNSRLHFNCLLLVPLLINTAASILSVNSGILFRITSENAYERGPLFFILPCVSFLYFIYSLIFTLRNFRKLSSQGLLMLCSFFTVPVLFTLVQIKYYIYLTTWNSAALIIIIAYIFIQNDQMYRDSLTGIENRLAYEHFIQKISRKKIKTLCMIFFDIDNFKGINDQHGHSEGDEAIRIFTRLIIASFPLKRRRIMRYGGDEFVVILEEEEQAKVDSCLSDLARKVNRFNLDEERPYRLDYSYGMGRFSDECNSVNQLMDHIDQLMYRQKQQKKDDAAI